MRDEGAGWDVVEPDAVTPVSPTAMRVRREVRAIEGADPDFWSFNGSLRARGTTPIFQYPAMMVSPMQGALLDAVISADLGGLTYDPFLGSGTTMVESMKRGLPFVGQDISPLAVLLSKVETAEVAGTGAEAAMRAIAEAAPEMPGEDVQATMWFRDDVAADLARVRHAIRAQPDVKIRRLAWASLAEVVRHSGNQRISTPKLQRRPAHQLDRDIDVIGRFLAHATHAARLIEEQAARFGITDGHIGYLPGVSVQCGDVRQGTAAASRTVSLVLTSPPYGDNHTTIPYGQAASLPLRWIDMDDIDVAAPQVPALGTTTLDRASLGGSLRVDAERLDDAMLRSPTLARVLTELPGGTRPWKRVASFWCDMDDALRRIFATCQSDAIVAMTLGDRTVARRLVPNSQIVRDLLTAVGGEPVDNLSRRIAWGRRIAQRNRVAQTISREEVLIWKLPG